MLLFNLFQNKFIKLRDQTTTNNMELFRTIQ